MSNKGKPSLLTRIRRFFAAVIFLVIGGETALLYRIYDAHGLQGLLRPTMIGQEVTDPTSVDSTSEGSRDVEVTPDDSNSGGELR